MRQMTLTSRLSRSVTLVMQRSMASKSCQPLSTSGGGSPVYTEVGEGGKVGCGDAGEGKNVVIQSNVLYL